MNEKETVASDVIDNMGYVSLHNHTTFSILDSLIKPIDLFKKAAELGQTAVAVTDHGTLAGMWDSLKASKETGVKLITGCEFYFVDDVTDENARLRHVVLLAKNQIGYKNLLLMSAEGYDNFVVYFKRAVPRIDWKLLEKYSEGLICLTACSNGILGQLINDKQYEEADKQAVKLKEIFGSNLGLEVQPHYLKRTMTNYSGQIDQALTNRKIREIAERNDIRCVAATDAHYVEPKQHDSHNVLLAIAAGSPVNSGSKLSYNVPDFYIKSGNEVYDKLKRQFILDPDKGDAFAKSCIDNSKYFADLCEEADWVDPKYSNPSGKELPEFPVKDQEDYNEFLDWCKDRSDLDKDEDELYIRYKCEIVLNEKYGTRDDYDIYKDRLEKELDVFSHCGVNSYMLLIADIIEWCEKNNISTGPGRGCLTGDSLVFTKNGFVNLKDIKINDEVYTHEGNLRKVKNTFLYNVNEQGLSINTNYSFDPIKLTSDHKVFAVRSEETDQYKRILLSGSSSFKKVKRWKTTSEPSWIKADELKSNDLIFMPFPIHETQDWSGVYDLGLFQLDNSYVVTDDSVIQTLPSSNNLSVRTMANNIDLSRSAIKNAKNGGKLLANTVNKISRYLANYGKTFKEWQTDSNTYTKNVNRFINKDLELLYIIGRWVGDGWIISKNRSHETGFAFHSEDTIGINRITDFFVNYGFNLKKRISANKKLTQIIIHGELLYRFFESIIPDYKGSSGTKHLPSFFRTLKDDQLKSLLIGLCDSDGHVEISSKYRRENFDTTSFRLAKEFKESLLYLKIPSSISTRNKYISNGYKCAISYKVRFKGLKLSKAYSSLIKESGYFCRIRDINKINLDTVYDISVDKDTSYVTSSYAVHNSAAGSLASYLLGIHEADPIKYGLVFERFFSKNKKDYADVDSDVSKKDRHKVIEYIISKYGRDNVAAISNFNTMTPKVYARSIARSFVYGGDRKTAVQVGTAIADAIPSEIGTVSKALEKASLFMEYAKEYTELESYAKDIGGLNVALSTHAAGIIVNKRALRGLVPLRRDKDGNVSIEYEKERVEENNLVKLDILGLKTLDVIDETYDLIKQCNKVPKPFSYEEYDKKTYDLISKGDTYGVFQFGTSGGTIDLCKKYKPKSIEDLAIITTLARPNAKNIRDDFFKVKNGDMQISYLHPLMKRAFENTLGFSLYDESLLILTEDLAKWDLQDADVLRKITKGKGKYPEKERKAKEKFISDTVKNGIDKKTTEEIWTKVIEPFSLYSFNKSHAVTYSFISYKTAWLKAHYPLEFLVANLKSEVNSNAKVAKDNIAKIKEEIIRLGVKIIPPDINNSDMTYKIIDENTLMTGLDSLKYMGKDAIPEILEKRPFVSFEDFLTKIDGRKVRAPAIQALAASGCLDVFEKSRKLMFLYTADYKSKLTAFLKRKKNDGYEAFNYPWPEEGDWSIPEKCALERFYLGESLSGDKVQEYGGFFTHGAVNFKNLEKLHPPPASTLSEKEQKKYKRRITAVQGEVKNMFEFPVKKEGSKIQGELMAKIILEDPHGNRVTMTCFPDGWTKIQDRCLQLSGNKHKMDVGVGLYINGSLNWYEGDISIIFEDLAKFSPPPQLPVDLKAKKVSMKSTRSRTKVNKEDEDRNLLLEEIENELAESGNADLDSWDDLENNDILEFK
jgi:DNA polymerase-3 subunit alpha